MAEQQSRENAADQSAPGAQLAQIAFIVLASIGVFSFVRAARNDQRITSCSAMCVFQPTYAGRNRTVPDFELADLSGKKVRFSSFLKRGKPVVLNFWTKTCKPCLEEMPSLAELAQIVQKDGIQVVTVSTDEGPEAVKDHLQVILDGKPPPFAVLFDPESENDWNTTDSIVDAYRPALDGVFEVRNLRQLADAVYRIT